MKDLIAKLHSGAADQILATFATLEMQLQGFAKSSYEKDLRIAELEAQIAAKSAPVVEQPEWMDFDIEKTGDDHFDAGNFLLNAAKEFWSACHKAKQYGAVQWLLGENSELLIFTRGEYKNVLLNNIEMSGPTKHFKEPQATDNLREALKLAVRQNSCDMLMTGEEIRKCEAALNSTALQAPVREVPEVNDAKYSEAEKVREAILSIEVSTSGSKGYAKAWSEGAEHMRDAVVNLFDIMAMQAPAQQWIDVEDRLPEDHQDVLVYHCPSAVPSDKE